MTAERDARQVPRKLSADWFERFDAEHEDGEADLRIAVNLLREHADACKIDESQLESAGEEIDRLNNSHSALVAENERLKRDLEKYGWHEHRCEAISDHSADVRWPEKTCSCGYDAALTPKAST